MSSQSSDSQTFIQVNMLYLQQVAYMGFTDTKQWIITILISSNSVGANGVKVILLKSHGKVKV